ncbi:DUF559 domain-containing protein [Rhodococcus sp. BP-241]|uniref:DUF559 domain-containing protein n=1 Tax=Rhodococcus sp. BP-241 TaxID=2739441 RepID=UPI001C9B603E|nr:DUF559 domain-containing protein [Rhodococcus sp. BP-241]MBY6705331.1 DUF559 domain-containing protein [Rhodococcus sp. BP-241]
MPVTRVSTLAQLTGAGMSATTIRRRFHRVLPGVFCQEEPAWFDRCLAVTLWRPDALLSHTSAARLYGWIGEPSGVHALVGEFARPRAPEWLTVHRRRQGACDEVLGLPVTTREQTLIDCAAVLSDAAAERLVDDALVHEVDENRVRALLDALPGRRGHIRARRLVDTAARGFASEPERVLGRELIRRHLRMQTNVRVGAFVVDFYDELANLVVEVDGYAFHSAPEVFCHDRRRQNFLILGDLRVLRYAAFDVLKDPGAVADEIVAEVRRRRHARR